MLVSVCGQRRGRRVAGFPRNHLVVRSVIAQPCQPVSRGHGRFLIEDARCELSDRPTRGRSENCRSREEEEHHCDYADQHQHTACSHRPQLLSPGAKLVHALIETDVYAGAARRTPSASIVLCHQHTRGWQAIACITHDALTQAF